MKYVSNIFFISFLVNKIGDEGAKSLAEALKYNSSITELDLGSEFLKINWNKLIIDCII